MDGVHGGWRGARKKERYAAYVDLVSRGVGRAEAGRRVGVSWSTVRRWDDREVAVRWSARGRERALEREIERAGRVSEIVAEGFMGLPPRAERGRYLSFAERQVIDDLVRDKIALREIARLIERSASTISRELDRNGWVRLDGQGNPTGPRSYGAHAAERHAAQRRRRPKVRKLEADSILWAHVRDRVIVDQWSPEQIAHTLPEVFPDRPEHWVCHETIYQALYVQARSGLRPEIAAGLRTGRVVRCEHRDPAARSSRFREPMVMVSERPAEADDRAVPGHWEGDLIIGEHGASAMVTLVERHSRFTMIAPLPAGRDAAAVRDVLIELVGSLPAELARSLTWDQGSEMARHHEFSIATGIPVYFCDPASPWMRGSNENTNGLLRQYFPKGSDLSIHSSEHCAAVAAKLNARPRKTLGWATPAQRLATVLPQASQQRCCDHP